ncbi:hypothetical protein NGRA_0273 [Nosema granulosis]|uniref:Uncharacterized protein n=1 Tax=Nosema granulosis TaxID=83296 RepID=A0A9P6H292_9MICR|nr:hypothetical protein NGRA_0273 [Nosema granulosis]
MLHTGENELNLIQFGQNQMDLKDILIRKTFQNYNPDFIKDSFETQNFKFDCSTNEITPIYKSKFSNNLNVKNNHLKLNMGDINAYNEQEQPKICEDNLNSENGDLNNTLSTSSDIRISSPSNILSNEIHRPRHVFRNIIFYFCPGVLLTLFFSCFVFLFIGNGVFWWISMLVVIFGLAILNQLSLENLLSSYSLQ